MNTRNKQGKKTEKKTRRTQTAIQPVHRLLELRIRLTHGGLVFEKLWSALWPATGLVGGYLVLALFEVWSLVPEILQFLCLLSVLVLSGLSFVRQLAGSPWPQREDAMRRMEISAVLLNRPLSERDDDIGIETADTTTRELWQHHKERQEALLRRVQASSPLSDLPLRDPNAVRIGVALLFVVGALIAGPDTPNRLLSALQPGFSLGLSGKPHVTAWIDPPGFTGLAPLYLTASDGNKGATFTVPQRSSLVIRVADARGTPSLSVPGGGKRERAVFSESGLHEITRELDRSGTLKLKDRGRTLGSWTLSITPDAAPFTAFEEAPKETDQNELGFTWIAQDDYGIGTASLVMEVDRTQSDMDAPHENRLQAELPLPGSAPKSISERTELDLTEHYFAGLSVSAELVVKDFGGQEGRSEVVRFALPERDFFEPLALAIVEQRRNLARDPADWAFVMRALEAITFAPEQYFNDLTVYIGLRTAYWQLDRVMPQTLDQITPTLDLLWEIALHVEDGNLSLAEQELRAIAKALQEALARGAPMDEIERLMQRYQQALERYLAALSEKALADAQDSLEDLPEGGLSMNQQDLMDLLKAIEEMARTGDKTKAAEMLAELQRMLENMTMRAGGGMNGPESELAEQIEGLSDLIGKERSLMDETLRRSQEEGEDATQGGGAQPDLAEQQEGLRGELGGLEDEDSNAAGIGQAMGEADEAMGDSEEALNEGDSRRALHAQRRAIDAMREAAEALAEELQRSMEARGAAPAGDEEGLDPLGREEGGRGRNYGDHIKVPEERDLQRARDILEELKKRASDPNRPDIELEYLERLLKRF